MSPEFDTWNQRFGTFVDDLLDTARLEVNKRIFTQEKSRISNTISKTKDMLKIVEFLITFDLMLIIYCQYFVYSLMLLMEWLLKELDILALLDILNKFDILNEIDMLKMMYTGLFWISCRFCIC